MKPVHPHFGLAWGEDRPESPAVSSANPSRLRRWVRRAWGACFGVPLDQQQWTWFLPNPVERPPRNGSDQEKDSSVPGSGGESL